MLQEIIESDDFCDDSDVLSGKNRQLDMGNLDI